MKQKALLVISHGTVADTAGIAKSTQALENSFPEYNVYSAYTSEKVTKRLLEQRGIVMLHCTQCIQQLLHAGYQELACQSLHIIPGTEYWKLRQQIEPFAHQFQRLTIGKPLLWDARDIAYCARYLTEIAPIEEGEVVIWIGHGSLSFANNIYSALWQAMKHCGGHIVSTLEQGVHSVIAYLKEHHIQTVRLNPLMLTAGQHVKCDIISSENSWRHELIRRGYTVYVSETGLGEYAGVTKLFCQHAKESIAEL